MNKTNLKKTLNTLSKDEIIQIVLEIYDSYSDVKEKLNAQFAEDKTTLLKEALDKYKFIIRNEFFPSKGADKCRVSVCKKAISDFKKLKPSPIDVADLMVFFVEQGCQYTSMYGDMWESFYTSIENNYRSALDYIFQNELENLFKDRLKKCVDLTEDCGWGFNDVLGDFFYEYYEDE